MCDSIANGGPRCVASCPPSSVTIASNVLSTTGDIYASNGTFTGSLTVTGIITGPTSLSNLVVANSVTTTNVFFQNRILSTNLPVFNTAQGTWGSSANVSQVTVDQYGRVSAAANVAITSSQWTSNLGNVAYQNGVSIGTLSAPPVGTNLYVLGTATISNINSNGAGLSSLNAANLSGPASLTNLYVANSVTTTNVTAGGTLGVTGAMTSNVDNTTFFFDTFTIPYINSQVGNITTLNVSSISNLNSVVLTNNLYAPNALSTTNLFATSANVGTLNVFQVSNLSTLVLVNNIYVANSITTTNLVTAGITSNASNTIFNFDTLTIPFINSTTLNVASTSNLVTAEMQGSLGSTTLRLSGNVVVSNALTTQNLISNLVATGNVAPTIASATTIAPTSLVSFVSGTTAIATITAPWPVSTGGTIMLIPTDLWTTTTAGNIALASTAVVFRTVHMTWDSGTSKWYPSY